MQTDYASKKCYSTATCDKEHQTTVVAEKPTNTEVVELPPTQINLQQPQSGSVATINDDTTVNEGNNESPIQGSDNTMGSSSIRRGRGVTTGKSIEKAILENDKKPLEIEFPEDKSVQEFMEEIFQRSYTHWRGRLSATHKDYIMAGKNPRASSPFEWISIENWCQLCDLFESETFKKRSKTNASNRSHMPFTHTSGSKSYHSRLLEMVNQSPVENFANTHRKNGVFVSEKAEAAYREMERLRTISTDSDSDLVSSEREIIKIALGNKSGYDKGLGYGVVPSKRMKKTLSESTRLKEKLNVAEEELRNARTRLTTQAELIDKQEALIQTHNAEIAGLKEGQNELKEQLSYVLQKFGAIP
ncbi:hypothetical protein KSP39_PZI016200 [Platanthera zijinensis]|uniref:Transposase n=1 Tax=Platanthera zijinensis TaxID=2320716 RepID=A0AAP0B6H7_9ASPA